MAALPASLKPADLPTPPKVALEVMQACSRDDCSNADLGVLAGRDPGFTAEALRIVNSAWFGFGQEVRTVAHAAVILGQQALRNLVLCIAVRDALKGVAIANIDTAGFWEDALRRAVAARLLAARCGHDPEEAFTAGLLQDFGLLVLFYLYPEPAVPWAQLRALDPAHRLARERELFPLDHAAMGQAVATQWELPGDLCAAIGAHHDDEQDGRPRLQVLLAAADWLAAVYECDAPGACLGRCRTLLGEWLTLGEDDIEQCLAALPAALEEAAGGLGLDTRAQPAFEELMRETNVTLAEQNLSYQELTLRLENTLRERDRLAAELDRELEQARQIQRALLPGPMPEGFPVAGINESARQLSGDFYDYFSLPGGEVFFCLGDVSGKGANAAILMSKVASLCRCLAKQMDDLPAMVATMNREITETSAHGMFVTLICGRYAPGTGDLILVNAGHLPALVLRPGEKPRLLKARGVPLGVLEDSVFEPDTCNLGGARLYLFSDGITEHRGADGELGLGGLMRLLVESWRAAPAEQLACVIDSLRSGAGEAQDDLTLLRLTGA